MIHWWKKMNEDAEKRLAEKNAEEIKDAFNIVVANRKMYITCGSRAIEVIATNRTVEDVMNEVEDMVHVAIEYKNSNIKN